MEEGTGRVESVTHNAEDVRLQMPFVRWRVMADQLAEAIRNHGPWMDDQCRAVLAAYDAMAQSDG